MRNVQVMCFCCLLWLRTSTYCAFFFFVQLSSKRETCGDKSRQLRDAQQDARDKVEVRYWQAK